MKYANCRFHLGETEIVKIIRWGLVAVASPIADFDCKKDIKLLDKILRKSKRFVYNNDYFNNKDLKLINNLIKKLEKEKYEN